MQKKKEKKKKKNKNKKEKCSFMKKNSLDFFNFQA